MVVENVKENLWNFGVSYFVKLFSMVDGDGWGF